MVKPPAYKVFLSMNFTRDTAFIVDIAAREARRYGFDIAMLKPGTIIDNPARAAREILERQNIEGLLAIIFEESTWVSNEIGMAYAFHLPVYVVYDKKIQIEGIAKLITSMNQIDIFSPSQLKSTLGMAFPILQKRIENNRRGLSEPPAQGKPVFQVRWEYYWVLVNQANKIISMDVDPNQLGFKPTMLVGISRGGIIVADLLSRLGGDRSLCMIEADRASLAASVGYKDEPFKTVLKAHLEELGSNHQARILIVDDVIKSGRSLNAAVSKVSEILDNIVLPGMRFKPLVKSLVLLKREDSPQPGPDYFFVSVPKDSSILLPYGLG